MNILDTILYFGQIKNIHPVLDIDSAEFDKDDIV